MGRLQLQTTVHDYMADFDWLDNWSLRTLQRPSESDCQHLEGVEHSLLYVFIVQIIGWNKRSCLQCDYFSYLKGFYVYLIEKEAPAKHFKI